ncbi:hypothetical protein Holit_00958 [Hollandina sp. SP2]
MNYVERNPLGGPSFQTGSTIELWTIYRNCTRPSNIKILNSHRTQDNMLYINASWYSFLLKYILYFY